MEYITIILTLFTVVLILAIGWIWLVGKQLNKSNKIFIIGLCFMFMFGWFITASKEIWPWKYWLAIFSLIVAIILIAIGLRKKKK